MVRRQDRFDTLVSETAKCSKSVNSFDPTGSFVGVIRSSLSVRVVGRDLKQHGGRSCAEKTILF